MDAPGKPSLLQRVIDAWKHENGSVDTEFDAADMGTAYGLDYSMAARNDIDDDLLER